MFWKITTNAWTAGQKYASAQVIMNPTNNDHWVYAVVAIDV
jgi:hypothetical protein